MSCVLGNNLVEMGRKGLWSKVVHNFVGQRFGRLVVQRRVPGSAWMCQCDCGKVSFVLTGNLKSGGSQSCGCLWKEKITTHGLTGSPAYKTWKAMHERCRSVNPLHRANYLDRGIAVCEEWRDFVTFLRDMGPRPSPRSELDRVDNDKGYSKANCEWRTHQQNLNNKRTNRYLEYNGRTQTIAQWAAEHGMVYRTLNNRINRGWPVERALTEGTN